LRPIHARYYDGRTSARRDVEVWIRPTGQVLVLGLGEPREWPLSGVRVSDRIAQTPRTIAFPDGSLCELADNDAVDAALAALGGRGFLARVGAWERAWPFALGALIAVGLLVWAGLVWGAPWLARHAADRLPASVDRALGQGGLEGLDRAFFGPSALPEPRQDEIRAHFSRMTAGIEDGHDYRLELRAGGVLGANAFALPSGIVVMTDELVELAGEENEIVAVLAHEVGHVRGRHSLRLLLQDSVAALLLVAILGDVSSASLLVASVPTVLVEAKHSRAIEAEADDFAYAWLEEHGIPTHHFGDLLLRLEEEHGGAGGFSYLSSHPPTQERARD
jgi:Zn-dependent protease with chaperone function